MNIFGTDPKDEIIALLKEQLAQKDIRIAELEKQNMAFSDRAAFALAYPRANVPVSTKPAEIPADIRAPFKPKFTREQIEKSFERTA